MAKPRGKYKERRKGYYVFNIAQVENYNPANTLINSEIETKEEADHFFNTLNPTINYGGDLAFARLNLRALKSSPAHL